MSERRLAGLGVYLDRRVASLLFLGFSSGLPLALTGATLFARLEQAGVTLTEIGLVGLVGIAYSLKFLWSPLVDRLPLPVLTRRLGRRRAWMLLAQLTLLVAVSALAPLNPATPAGLWQVVFWTSVVAFASATQDIAIDAYRTEILEESKLGAGAANLVFGYRIAMLVSGGGALILAGLAGWGVAYAAMAVCVVVGIVTVLVNPEPALRATPEFERLEGGDKTAAPSMSLRGIADWVYGAVVCPFVEFMTRPGWLVVLLFILFYKYGDALLGFMATPFYLRIGFSLAEIGVISKGWGLVATLLGAGIGGWFVARYGILKSLLICGILQAASNLVFALQAWIGYSVPMLTVTIGVENLTGGMGTTAFVAYLSSLCNLSYTATQYALLSSAAATGRTVLAAGGGWLADQTGWLDFFLLTTLAALPGLLLLLVIMWRYSAPAGEPEAPPGGR
ncbi:MAG: AmpG family muropeptide MFS transporter [Alphaproteobacteria bacterium]|nr:AmpG family muropeptide MFS transporter [Alphaproteobacteria bacterium]